MRVVVTGGAGLVGSAVVQALRAGGHEAIVVDDLSSGRRENLPPDVPLHILNVLDDMLPALLGSARPEAVVHLAAQVRVPVSVENPAHDARVNIEGTIRVAVAALWAGARAVVFSSTGGALYGEADRIPTPETARVQPPAPYGIAKAAAEAYLENLCLAAGARFLNLRFANVYGPRQDALGEAGVVSIFARTLLTGRRATIYGDGRQTRDFVYVDDVAQAVVRALGSTKSGTWNIGTGVETSVLDLYAAMAVQTGRPGDPAFAPARPQEVRRSALDPARARVDLGWAPAVSLGEGLARTVAWFKDQLRSESDRRS